VRMVGKGASANTFLVKAKDQSKSTPNSGGFAWKVMTENKESEESAIILKKEWDILNILSLHPNVIQCYEVLENVAVEFETNSEFVNCCILEYASNGSLHDFVKKCGRLPEDLVLFFFVQILSVIKYMHECNIVHLDIKPMNLLLDDWFNIKVWDFGTSEIMSVPNLLLSHRRGTQQFMAPEVSCFSSHTPYDPRPVDVYALAITAVNLLRGELNSPKIDTTNESTVINSRKHKSDLNQNIMDLDVSQELQELITSMLWSSPAMRPSVDEIWEHPWVQKGLSSINQPEIYSLIQTLNNW